MSQLPEISPCPYCGEDAEITVFDGKKSPYSVTCRNNLEGVCNMNGPWKPDKFAAIIAWNWLRNAVITFTYNTL